MRLGWLVMAAVVGGCNSGGDSETDIETDTEEDGPLVFEDLIFVTDEAVGDVACHTPGDPWTVQNVDTTKVAVESGNVAVLDFESETPVPDASTTIWYSDDVTTTPDSIGTTDEDGFVTLDVERCSPIAYKTATDPDLAATRDTYEAHEIVEPGEDPVEFESVSSTTYQIIPSLLGISPDVDKGIIAGRAYGCDDEPILNAQVIVVDDAGVLCPTQIVKYFVDEFPNRDQPWTSEDGLWVAVNIPEGPWTVQLWTVQGGVQVLTAETRVVSYANSINVSNTYVGFGDGVKYPEACLLP